MKALVLTSMIIAIMTLASNNAMAVAPVVDVPKIKQEQQELRQKVLAGKGAYKDIDAEARLDLLDKQETVMRLLEGRKSTSELSPPDQVTLVNTLGMIAAIVEKAEDERMVCRREKMMGSNRPETICKTVAQLRREREEANSFLTSPRSAACVTQCGEQMGAEGW